MNEKDIKKLNRQKTAEYKKQLKSEIFDVDNELQFNENGSAIVECKIGKLENVFNQFDIAKDRTMTREFNNYLEEEAEIIPIRYNLELKLHVNENFTDENEKQLQKALKRHFSFYITADSVKLKRNIFKFSILFIFGILCLFLTTTVGKINTGIPVYETLLVLTWFFLWEGISSALFDRNTMRIHRLNLLRLYNATINIVRDKEPVVEKTTIIADKATIITDRSTVYSDKKPRIQTKLEKLQTQSTSTPIHTEHKTENNV